MMTDEMPTVGHTSLIEVLTDLVSLNNSVAPVRKPSTVRYRVTIHEDY